MEGIEERVERVESELFARVYPRQPADTVIVLHGGPGVPMDYQFIVQQLSKHYQVIVFDQRGTALSPVNRTAYTIAEYIADINAIAEHFGLLKFHLFGHGWGGLYAQLYAQQHADQVRSLFLSSPIPGTGTEWHRAYREFKWFHRKKAGLVGAFRMESLAFYSNLGSDASCRALIKMQLDHYVKGHAQAIGALSKSVGVDVGKICSRAINKTLKQIVNYPPLKEGIDAPYPVLIAYGEHDVYRKSHLSMQKRYKNAAWVVVPNAGHLSWIHNPEFYAHLLSEFYQLQPLAKTGS